MSGWKKVTSILWTSDVVKIVALSSLRREACERHETKRSEKVNKSASAFLS
jgi:hypothetical protein